MRLSRIIMALTVGLAVVAVPTAAGAAQPQPEPTATQPPPYPQPAALTAPPVVAPGQTFAVTGTGFLPGEQVRIVVSFESAVPVAAPLPGQARRSDGTTIAMAPVAARQPQPPAARIVTADAEGDFSTTYRLDSVGVYRFVATGLTSGRTASTTVTVRGAPPLPVTGSSVGTPMKIGGGLVGAGAVLLLMTLAWRKRHHLGIGAAR
ncbi:hypothetical protein [Micromonospora deserti]|uniref:Peptidase n=1 Tax=Micromonospora deserti TaxID=2070366 RepID=A0A2W2CT84_9ACTN|nr:hypothetical protein [Micromonospora deserti]PZF91599.1 hypothetical protein C1I99_23215 [Micromonospora deserti]